MAQGATIHDNFPAAKQRDLVYVFVVSRHGQRTPATQCALLPKPCPENYGQLTAYGLEQARVLGSFLRERYASFLSDQPGEVFATHNKYQPTSDSVCHTVEGMGLPAITPVLDKSNYDLLYDAAIAGSYKAIMDTPSRGHFRTLRDIVGFVCKHTGSPADTQKITLLCLDSLLTCVSNGHPIPGWARPYWDEIKWADRTAFSMALAGAERPMAAYILTRILRTLSDKYEKGIDGIDKMHLFCVSDNNLYSVMKLLNSLYDARPGFCSALLVEVFREGDHMMAGLLYAEDLDPQPLRMQKLSNPSLLADFMTELRCLLHNRHNEVA